MIIINIINLPKRTERKEAVIKQMEMEKCQYMFWDGIELPPTKVVTVCPKTLRKQVQYVPNTKKAINLSHKLVIKDAKDRGLERCIVAEDDLCWTGSGAWEYFMQHIPSDYDIYVGSYYSGSHNERFEVTKFCGLTLYICHNKYYDKFLSLPEHEHIDKAIDRSNAKIIVCPLFVAIQSPGWSDQRKMFCKNEIKKGKPIYGCN